MNNRSFCYTALFIILLTTFSNQIKAQWYNPEKVVKKAGAIYGQALELAQDENYDKSIAAINEAIKIDPRFVEAYLSRSGIYATIKDYDNSVTDFEMAMALDSVFTKEYNLPYSISLSGIGCFEEALVAIEKFSKITTINERSRKAAKYRKNIYEFAIAYQQQHKSDYAFLPLNLGDSVNSADLEYYPSLTIDGSRLIITRRIKNDEDFYECDRINDSTWRKALPLRGMINTDLNEGAQNISQDGNWLVFTGCNYPEGEGSCDLYIAYETKKGGWSEAENMGSPLNSESWEASPSLSPDKRDLYFASNRPGGYGGKDIWVSHRTANGKWSKPENLGPDINTSADEGCPFIHADNQTLYFNSNGLQGYGAADLFVVRKDISGEWGIPENLGYPINTIDEEGSLIVASDGVTSYYASDRNDSKGGLDIYSFKLRKEATALQTLWVKGKISDKKTKAGLPSKVELTDINSRKTIYSLQTDEEGNYLIPLPIGKDYAFNVNRKGYLFYSENFSFSKQASDSPRIINIVLQPLEAGAFVILKNIFFDLNKFSLSPGSNSELDKIVALMKDNPAMVIEIGGHTDKIGKDADNLALSMSRAKEVVNYLTSKGIDNSKLTPKGYGASKPIASNETEEGRALNRRTELRIISN